MTLQRKTQLPISISGGEKSDVRTQFAALCYRVVDSQVQVMVITSRRTKRWIIPKGWPMDAKTPAKSAAIEAYEEAGVEGKVFHTCLGVFSYTKSLEGDAGLPCLAMVFPLKVKTIHKRFPERAERRRKWVSLKKAAKLIEEPELRQIILTFDPSRLRA
jgi:8-oxo-dGTP pyrophosphatase MutT (NUDIX family)